jgi:hypothetical protein
MGFLDRAFVGAHPLPHEVTLGSGCTAFALARGSPNQLNNPKASFAQHGGVFSLRRESVSEPAWLGVSWMVPQHEFPFAALVPALVSSL